MKSIFFSVVTVGLLTMTWGCQQSGSNIGVEPYKVTEAGLSWYTIDDIDKMKNIEDKTILIDVYTDWCGWCKKLDKDTFGDAQVVEYLNDNFIMVKFNAEQHKPVTFNGETYESIQMGRKKTNKLAVKLLDGRLGYPALVYLDGSSRERIKLDKGYKTPNQMITVLQGIVNTAATSSL